MIDKIAIISLPRSGSTYMLEIAQFMQHYNVDYCEPFHTGKNPDLEYDTDYKKFVNKLKNIKNSNSALIKDIGNLFWYISQKENHFEKFKDLDREYRNYVDANFYTVYIDRQNLFDIVLSYSVASETGKWHRKRFEFGMVKKITVSTELFAEAYYTLKRQKNYVENFCEFDRIVDYDRLSFNPKQDLKTVFDFDLHSNKKPSTVANARKNTTVKNYTELKQLYTTLGANNE